MREHLKDLADTEETTIMLTSHDTGDIEEICDRVILINHGQILLDKPLRDLRSEFLTKKEITLITDEEDPQINLEGAEIVDRDRHRITLSVDQSKYPINRVVAQALQALSVRDISIENAPLETIIRHLYGDEK